MKPAALALLALSMPLLAAEKPGEPTTIRFAANDGTQLTARLWGTGSTALILCHGRRYTTGAASFDAQCRALAARGIRCLALSFRGYPADAPPVLRGREKDIMAAFGYLATHGARRIYVLGSSMGGFTALAALKDLTDQPQFAGIIILSAVDPKACAAAECPKLFFVAKDDARLYRYMLTMFYAAAPPKQAVVFKSGGHGQQLFTTHGREILDHIHLFVRPETEAAPAAPHGRPGGR